MMDKDVVEYRRSVYTILNLLGDIGGLQGALTWLGLVLMVIFGSDGTNKLFLYKIFRTEALQEADVSSELRTG